MINTPRAARETPIDNRFLVRDIALSSIHSQARRIPGVTPVPRIRLGKLEIAVLEHLWSVGDADAKAVHSIIGTQRGITLNTIQSTLERLHDKGLLSRGKVSHAYIYVPKLQREQLMGRIIEDVMTAFSDGKSQPMLSAFVDFAARVDERNLERLERLIAARREAQEPKP